MGLDLRGEYNAIGIDLNEKIAKIANNFAKMKGNSFQCIVGDAEKLPFRDKVFDICFCGDVLHHFPDISEVMDESTRCLKSNGKIILIEPNGNNIINILARKFAIFIMYISSRNFKLFSPNEVNHSIKYYIKMLSERKYNIEKIFTHYKYDCRRTINKNPLIKLLCIIREFLFKVAWITLLQPSNGPNLIIIAKLES